MSFSNTAHLLYKVSRDYRNSWKQVLAGGIVKEYINQAQQQTVSLLFCKRSLNRRYLLPVWIKCIKLSYQFSPLWIEQYFIQIHIFNSKLCLRFKGFLWQLMFFIGSEKDKICLSQSRKKHPSEKKWPYKMQNNNNNISFFVVLFFKCVMFYSTINWHCSCGVFSICSWHKQLLMRKENLTYLKVIK